MSPEPDLPDGADLAEDLSALFIRGGKLPPKSAQEPSEEAKLWDHKKRFIQYFIRSRFPQIMGPIREEAVRIKTELEKWQNDPGSSHERTPVISPQSIEVIRLISFLDIATFSQIIVKGAVAKLADLPMSPSPERSSLEAVADFHSKVSEIAQAAHELG